MPRRGSRAQLIHMLADLDAWMHREVCGDHHVYPQDFYDHYRNWNLDELRDWARQLRPRHRGRPRRWSDAIDDEALSAEIDRLRRQGRHSVRNACRLLARRAQGRVSENAIRDRYRRAARIKS
jgi:hypothetical protein